MGLLVVFIATLVVGQSIAIFVGLLVERHYSRNPLHIQPVVQGDPELDDPRNDQEEGEQDERELDHRLSALVPASVAHAATPPRRRGGRTLG